MDWYSSAMLHSKNSRIQTSIGHASGVLKRDIAQFAGLLLNDKDRMERPKPRHTRLRSQCRRAIVNRFRFFSDNRACESDVTLPRPTDVMCDSHSGSARAYPAGAGWGLGLNPGCNPRRPGPRGGSNNLNL